MTILTILFFAFLAIGLIASGGNTSHLDLE